MMGNCYVPGFAPALTFLRSQILCRLYKSPSDETIKLEEEEGTPTSIPASTLLPVPNKQNGFCGR